MMKTRWFDRFFAFLLFTLLICGMMVSPALAHFGPDVHSSWATVVPTINGAIAPGEWTDATVVDFSLELRWRGDGSLNETLDARFLVKNNWTHIFAAVQIFSEDYDARDFTNQFDGLSILFEDNHDGSLSAGDNGEGVTTWTGSPFYSKHDLYYTGSYWDADVNAGQTNDGLLSWSHTNPVEGAIGNYTFEMVVPFDGSDGDAYDLDITTLPETVGFKIWFHDECCLDGVYPDVPAITQNVQEVTNASTFGTLVIHPLYTLNITADAGGTTSPAPGSYLHPYGTVVDVLATPDVCYEFDHWELDTVDVGSTNPFSVTMDDNHTLHAVFRLIYYNLTITADSGGTTAPAPGVYSHPCGSSVDVLATPNAGYYFDHWELDTVDVGSTNPFSVTMDDNHGLHAVFEHYPVVGGYTASVSPANSILKVACYMAVLAVPTAVVIAARRRRK